MTADTRWLDDDEQQTWRAFLTAQRLLFDRLERQLQRDAGLPHAYYEILVRLSEAPDRTLRMSQLADSSLSSRSRLSHAVARLEAAGWVRRRACAEDRRGAFAGSPPKAWPSWRSRRPGTSRPSARTCSTPSTATSSACCARSATPWSPTCPTARSGPWRATRLRTRGSRYVPVALPARRTSARPASGRPARTATPVRQPRPQLGDRHPPPVGDLLGLVAHGPVVPGLEREQVAAQPARALVVDQREQGRERRAGHPELLGQLPRRGCPPGPRRARSPRPPSSRAARASPASSPSAGDVDTAPVTAAHQHPAHAVPERPRVHLAARRDAHHRARLVVDGDGLRRGIDLHDAIITTVSSRGDQRHRTALFHRTRVTLAA